MAIICGTDFSDASKGALEVARALASQRGDRELVLVHVVEREDDAPRARASVDAMVEKGRSGPPVRTEVVVGAVDTTLISFAETEGSDLIVVAASSRERGGEGAHVGSTAEAVISSTRVPVLVVRDPVPWLKFARGEAPLRVMLGIDDSVACEHGIQWTLALRAHGPVDVVLGAVYYPDEAGELYGLHASSLVDRDPEIERLLSRDLVRRFGGPADDAVARPRRGLGRIGDHLVELAREEETDAIIVGTAQKTGLGRLGSVSSVVIHDAPQSVVCVPPNAIIPTLRVPNVTRALVATDLSQFANRAVPFAFALTPEANGAVHLAHVVRPDAEIDESEVARQLFALAPVGMTREVQVHVVRGDDAATAIAQTAARLGVDVICIASHGRSGITRALVGSVADRLLRASRKPVLVLRPT
ncbi:MAG TPA: universal stress protein [Kofleriaceae bacterium]|jgi:nucleotide-binding universal stress UspA family protein